ncbi:WD40-repeat-containing domain protein [Phialemonium atrogriseum]|uniref:WD40-repeat-containing domain protein n=1 Tax=Phialemonium atrogriseum TaxID=1093897 RepID=A0AAJ0C3L7_9PEZI|nr:WD40-repeat-containing domain protein [Phialemonium atrogriseum]KAK1769535.1 WD40-repeat-containing domain protein [Phialemonium atrogriseum]
MSLKHQDDLSDDSSSGFEEEVLSSDEEVKKSAAAAIADKDSEEEELERLVLGGKANFREQLFKDDFGSALLPATGLDAGQLTQTTGLEDIDDSALFFIDAPAATADKQLVVSKGLASDATPGQDAPAWEDSDDERLSISLAGVSQLRKLRISEAEDVVNGTEYARRLRQQYLRLYPHPAWAQEAEGRLTKRRRRSSASSFSSSASEGSDAEEGDASPLPLDKFLRDANSLTVQDGRKKRKLRPETIDIQRTRDIPDAHRQAVASLSFHPHYPILLSSSLSSILHLHHIAPTAYPTPNPSLTSVQLKGTPIRRSEFLSPNGDEIIFAGRRKFFHSWNLSSGVVKKMTHLQGHRQEQKTSERFRTSPCGRYMALIATDRKGGGMLNIINVNTMQWAAQARIDGRGGIGDFAWWSNGDGITILGMDGGVAEWSMLMRRTVGTWRDSGSIRGTVMALGGSNGPSELGGDRWVALGCNSGILNIYDRNSLVTRSAEGKLEIKALPEPTKSLDHLTTPISVVTFAPDGQLLAFASNKKKDALRLVHLPSCTVYRNWPTDQTPLGRVTAVAFGNGSDLLTVGNDTGKIRMWEIRS